MGYSDEHATICLWYKRVDHNLGLKEIWCWWWYQDVSCECDSKGTSVLSAFRKWSFEHKSISQWHKERSFFLFTQHTSFVRLLELYSMINTHFHNKTWDFVFTKFLFPEEKCPKILSFEEKLNCCSYILLLHKYYLHLFTVCFQCF